MEVAEVERIIKQGLASAGALEAFNREKSQVFEFPEDLFAEIVLNDGSRLTEAEAALRQIQSDLEGRGVRLDSIVRASWSVRNIERVFDEGWVVDSSRPGGFLSMPILRFKVTLESGPRQAVVLVDMTPEGFNYLKKVGRSDETSVDKVVKDFVTIQLSVGGTSYWDPIRYPRQEMNEAAVLYTLHHSPVVAA